MIVRKLISAIIMISVLFNMSSVFASNDDEISIFVNGDCLSFDVPPIINNNRTLVPMRGIFEAVGYSVDWNEEKQRIIASKDNSMIRLDIGDTVAIFGDYETAHELDVPPLIIDDRTMVPLRFVAEAANYDVIWEGDTKTVFIETIFDGDISPRPNQAVAMLGDKMMWANGMQISHDGRIFDEVDFANSNTLQLYKEYIYFRNADLILCRANVDTYKAETVINFPVTNVLVLDDKLYYSKIGDASHKLFRSNLDGSEETCVVSEPCGDYRVLGDEMFYIHLTNQNLRRTNIATGETHTIYAGFTTCFDIYQSTVYYSMAEYVDEVTPLAYKGIKQYNLLKESYELGVLNEGVAIENLWILGDNLFYEASTNDETYDIYRHNLKQGYNVKIMSDVLGGTELHGKRIFYYPVDNEYPHAKGGGLYIANTRGTNGFPLISLVFSAIGIYGIDESKPDDSVFDEYLNRDIGAFVLEKYATQKFDYLLLTKTAEGDMNGGCRYYVWVNIYSGDGSLLESGVLSVRAENKTKFVTETLRTKSDIVSESIDINSFPKVIRKRILELSE